MYNMLKAFKLLPKYFVHKNVLSHIHPRSFRCGKMAKRLAEIIFSLIFTLKTFSDSLHETVLNRTNGAKCGRPFIHFL